MNMFKLILFLLSACHVMIHENFFFQKGWTALTIASSKGHVECVKLLLDAEIDHTDVVSTVSHSIHCLFFLVQ